MPSKRTTNALIQFAKMVATLCAAATMSGCIFLDYGDNERPDLDLECGEFSGDEPIVGFYWDDYEPLGRGCDAAPIEPQEHGFLYVNAVLWLPDSVVDGRDADISLHTRSVGTRGPTARDGADLRRDGVRVGDGLAVLIELNIDYTKYADGGRGEMVQEWNVDFIEEGEVPDNIFEADLVIEEIVAFYR